MTGSGTAGGAIGGIAGQWSGGLVGGAIGELFGPEAVVPGAMLGRRLGGYAGQLAGAALGEWLAHHMSHANKQADKGTGAEGDQAEACSNCEPPLKPPNQNRHDPCKVKSNTPTKGQNSMIDPDYRTEVQRDIESIQNGQVSKQGQDWVTNGRTYSQHDGTLYPKSGPGIEELPNRLQHRLLGQLNSNSYDNAMSFADALRTKGLMSEEQLQQVLRLWNKCPKAVS